MNKSRTWDILRQFVAGDSEKIRGIAGATGISAEGVRQWLNPSGGHWPKGLALLQLIHYLDAKGISVPEIGALNSVAYTLGKQIATGVIKLEEAQDILEYHPLSRHHIFRGLIYGKPFDGARREKTIALVERNGGLLENKTALIGTEIPAIHAGRSKRTSSLETIIESAGALVRGLKPLTDYLASDDCTKQDREILRRQLGSDLHNLADNLTMLMSEQARSNVIQKRKEWENAKAN